MNSNRKTAIIVGSLILIAYGVLASSIIESKIIGMIFELISGVAVISIALILLLIINLLEITGYSFAMSIYLYFPIMLNEVFLAIWLIIRGFNPPAIASGSAKQI